MTKPKNFADDHVEQVSQQRGLRLLAAAAAAAIGIGCVVLVSQEAVEAGTERRAVEEVPPAALPEAHRLATLDAGVDWERVERASDVSPLSVGAYER